MDPADMLVQDVDYVVEVPGGSTGEELFTAEQVRWIARRAVRKGKRLGTLQAFALFKSLDSHVIKGKWDADRHPRDDAGRFVAVNEIHDARRDPAKAEELRARVTDPAERAKLDRALGTKDRPTKTSKDGVDTHFDAESARVFTREFRHNLVAAVHEYRDKPTYPAENTISDIQDYLATYVKRLQNHYRRAYRQAKTVAAGDFGPDAIASPEWQAVKEAFTDPIRGARDTGRDVADLMIEEIEEYGHDWEGNENPDHRQWFMRREQSDLHDKVQENLRLLHDGHNDDQTAIWDALQVFLDRHAGPDRKERGQTLGRYYKAFVVEKGRIPWKEQQHPRDKHGQFISAGEIQEGLRNPTKAKELHEKVRPEDADLLKDMLSETYTQQPGQATREAMNREDVKEDAGKLDAFVEQRVKEVGETGKHDFQDQMKMNEQILLLGGRTRKQLETSLRTLGYKMADLPTEKRDLQKILRHHVEGQISEAKRKYSQASIDRMLAEKQAGQKRRAELAGGGGDKPSVKDTAQAMKDEVREYAKLGIDAGECNSGECEPIARRVVDRVRAAGGDASFGSPKTGPAHVWVVSGGKHYDAQHPNGVADPSDLTFFQDNPDVLDDGWQESQSSPVEGPGETPDEVRQYVRDLLGDEGEGIVPDEPAKTHKWSHLVVTQKPVSMMTPGEAASLKAGSKVFRDEGGEPWEVVSARKQKRTVSASHPNDPRSLESIELPYEVATVRLMNDWSQESKVTVSNESEVRQKLAGMWPDRLTGGKADDVPPGTFPPAKLAQGAAVEAEHTSDPAVAKEIARDHLAESSDYYDKLKQVEGGSAARSDSERPPPPEGVIPESLELMPIAQKFPYLSRDEQRAEIAERSRAVADTRYYKPGSTAQKKELALIKRLKKMAGDASSAPEVMGPEVKQRIDSLTATLAMGGLHPAIESAHRRELEQLQRTMQPIRRITEKPVKIQPLDKIDPRTARAEVVANRPALLPAATHSDPVSAAVSAHRAGTRGDELRRHLDGLTTEQLGDVHRQLGLTPKTGRRSGQIAELAGGAGKVAAVVSSHPLTDTRKVNQWMKDNLPFPAKIIGRRNGQVTIGADSAKDLHEHADRMVQEFGAKEAITDGLKNYVTLNFDEPLRGEPGGRPIRERKPARPDLGPPVNPREDASIIWDADERIRRMNVADAVLRDRRGALDETADRMKRAFGRHSDPDVGWEEFTSGLPPALRKNQLVMEAARSDWARLHRDHV